MGFYVNKHSEKGTRTLEIKGDGGNVYAFFHVSNPQDAQALIASVHEAAPAMQLESRYEASGQTRLIFKGNESEAGFIDAINRAGYRFGVEKISAPMNPWVVRSILGFAGQTLQLVSSYLRPSGKIDTATRLFAASNLMANTINLVYKGQEDEDPHQLRYLKESSNKVLEPALGKETQPISPDESRIAARGVSDVNHGITHTVNDFLKRNSVTVGEIGLRYFGAFGLAYPPKFWGKHDKIITRNPSSLRAYTGLSSIFGKTVALTSKIEDPYNPKPLSWLDIFREKYSFIAGGLVEITSYSALAYDCFANTKPGTKGESHGIVIRGKQYRDWLGAVGAAMFVLGYISRLWAPYGKRHVNMPELYAHVSDNLSQLAPEDVPAAMTAVAQNLYDHFRKEKGHTHSFGDIYLAILRDFQQHHAMVRTEEKSFNSNQLINSAQHKTSMPNPTVTHGEITGVLTPEVADKKRA